jgi:hypothetical protein
MFHQIKDEIGNNFYVQIATTVQDSQHIQIQFQKFTHHLVLRFHSAQTQYYKQASQLDDDWILFTLSRHPVSCTA